MIHKERLAVPCMYQRERKCDCPCHKHFYETDKQYESRLKRESYCFCRRTLLDMSILTERLDIYTNKINLFITNKNEEFYG